MAGSDVFPETPKHPNSRRDLEQRKADRLSGKLNAPIRGTRGLANIGREMQGRGPHSLSCQCLDCIPMALRPEYAPIPEGMEPGPPPPAEKIPGKKGFPKPGKKWDEQRGRSSN